MADCVQPIRDRLILNNKQIVEIVKFNSKTEIDIDKLEVIYNNISEFEEEQKSADASENSSDESGS